VRGTVRRWVAFWLLTISSALAAAPTEWRQGNWQIRWVSGDLQVSYCSAPLLAVSPPPALTLQEGQFQQGVLVLRWQTPLGETTWLCGMVANRFTLVASFPLPTSGQWAWLKANPNWLRGAVLQGDGWEGRTPLGVTRLKVSGTKVTVRWRRSPESLVAVLTGRGTRDEGRNSGEQVSVQVDAEVPSQWWMAEGGRGQAIVHPVDVAEGEAWSLPLVPHPRWWRWGDSAFRLGRQVTLWAAREYELAAKVLSRWLREEWQREVVLRPWTPETPIERGIVLAPHRSPLREEVAQTEPLLRHELAPEGYALSVTPKGIWILAADELGALWGVQTLRQLLRLMDDGSLIVPGIFVWDAPDFAFRGVHVVADADSPEIHGRLIERVLSPLKFNRVIVQLDHLKWERHPELWQPWSLDKEGAKRLLEIAQANGLELIPLLPTLSHCEYLFGAQGGEKPKVNADIAEDPESAYLYCPNLEKTYRLVFDLLDEVLTLFRPRWVHIGHDEVTNQGRFGQCVRCQGTPPYQLFAADVRRLYEFLKGRGVGTMMWGDMLLRPDEAFDAAHGGEPFNFWLARKLLPKDIVIVDWHYQPAPSYPSVAVLQREGFSVIGATWRNFQNILGFTKAARSAGAWGMVQTTWTGFGYNRRALQTFPDQFAAYVFAADSFWSADAQSVRSLKECREVFEALWEGQKGSFASGFVVDLTPIANIKVATLVGVTTLKTAGRRWWRRQLFWLPTEEQGSLKAVALKSCWLQGAPSEVTLTINEPADTLTFLHATAFVVPDGTTVGGYELTLEDGKKITVPLVYGHHLRSLTDDRPLTAPDATPALRWETPNGSVVLSALKVAVGKGDEETTVRQVRFYAASEEASPLLVAIRGLSRRTPMAEAP